MDRFTQRQLLISICICFFWLACFLQVPQLREDYPFSYFGMYKGSLLNSRHSQFFIHIKRPQETEFKVHPVGTFASLNEFNEIILKEKKLKNRVYIREPIPISEQNTIAPSALPPEVILRAVQGLVGATPGTYDVKVIYKEWERLNANSIGKPSYELVLVDRTLEVPGD